MSKLVPAMLIADVASGCAGMRGDHGGSAGVYESPLTNPNDMRFSPFGQNAAFKRMIEK